MILRDVQPHTDRWHELRLQGIGGSEIGALFGCQPATYDTAYAILMQKKRRVEARTEANVRMQEGLEWESHIAELAAKKRGWKIRPGGYAIDDTLPQMRASIDYEIEEPTDEDRKALGHRADGPGIMQVKKVHDWWHYKKTWINGFPPMHIGLQHQHECGASGYLWGSVVVMAGGELCPGPDGFRPILEPARDRTIAEIRKRISAFWQRVENPADDGADLIDGRDATKDTIAAMWPTTIPDPEPLGMWGDKELAEICAGCLSGDADQKSAKLRRDEFYNRLKVKLGSTANVETEGFSVRVNTDKNGRRTITVREVNNERR